MKVIKELEILYFDIDRDYATKEFAAHAKGHQKKEQYWRQCRELNTHAYFLFLFTRLEAHIKDQSTKLINSRIANIAHWKTRAVWEIIEQKRLHFNKHTSLLTRSGYADFNLINTYYSHRNTIGHGGTIPGITLAINMITVFNDMKRLQRILRR